MRALVAMLAFVVASFGACSYFADDPPDRSCSRDLDCFRAQGEICDRARSVCIQAPDAGPPPDAEPDATEADATEADATEADAAPDALLPLPVHDVEVWR